MYKDVLSDLQALFSTYNALGTVVLAGDFNSQLINGPINKMKHSKKHIFTKFVLDNNLRDVVKLRPSNDPSYTYVPAKTLIDHVLVENDYIDNIRSANIVPETEVLTSDHLPIKVTLKIQTVMRKTAELQ